jgi:uncharacterized protein (TIGR02246 family)
MKQILIAMFALALAATAAQAQAKTSAPLTDDPALTAVRAAIDKGNAQWSEGWLKGDAALVAAVFEENGVQLAGSGKIIRGRQAIMERQKVGMAGADPGVKVSVVTLNVWLDGDTAYETGRYKYEYTDKGKPGTDEGHYVTIWKKQKDGSWKLAMDMGVPE